MGLPQTNVWEPLALRRTSSPSIHFKVCFAAFLSYYSYNLQDKIESCRMYSVSCCNEVTVPRYIYFSNLAVKQCCQLMRGCEPQFMDHMRSVSRGRLQILSLASKVDRLKKSSGNNYALLVSKKSACCTWAPSGRPRIAWSAVLRQWSQFAESQFVYSRFAVSSFTDSLQWSLWLVSEQGRPHPSTATSQPFPLPFAPV